MTRATLLTAVLVVLASACRVAPPAGAVAVRAPAHRAPAAVATTCAIDAAWLRRARERAVARGLAFIEAYLADDARLRALGADGVLIFLEPAATSASPAVRAQAERAARDHARRLLPRYLAPEGVRDARDFVDALDLLVDAPRLALPTERLLAVLEARFRAFARDDEAYGLPLGRAARLDDAQAFDLLLNAYTFERAASAWPGRFALRFGLEDALRVLWARPLAPRAAPGTTAAARYAESAYLATHVALVITEYGRHPLPRASLGRFERYLRAELAAYLRASDVELVGETADVLRQLGERDEAHALLCAATRFLLRTQHPDGSWGAWRAAPTPYRAVHETWAAVSGLVARAPSSDSAYRRRVAQILARLRPE